MLKELTIVSTMEHVLPFKPLLQNLSPIIKPPRISTSAGHPDDKTASEFLFVRRLLFNSVGLSLRKSSVASLELLTLLNALPAALGALSSLFIDCHRDFQRDCATPPVSSAGASGELLEVIGDLATGAPCLVPAAALLESPGPAQRRDPALPWFRAPLRLRQALCQVSQCRRAGACRGRAAGGRGQRAAPRHGVALW